MDTRDPVTRVGGRIFVGREREMAMLRAALEAVAGGTGRVVLVHGEAGIGKTRLLEELGREAQARGARVRWGRCHEREGTPAFWPWLQILRAELQSRTPNEIGTVVGAAASDLVHLLPELRAQQADPTPTPGLATAEARFRLFESVVAVLGRATAARAPLVLLIDDVQQADRASLVLLEFLSGALEAVPLLVVVAHRSPPADPSHPLAETLRQLGRRTATEHLALAGLDREAVGSFVSHALGTPAPEPLIEALNGVTRGNPLFLAEIVLELAADWRAETSPGAAVSALPPRVHEAITQHIASLSPGASDVLRAAAVLGQGFELATVGRMLNVPDPALTAAADEAQAARVLVADAARPGRYRFTHALIRDALYETLDGDRRRALHWQAGEALAAGADEDDRLPELAHHFAAACPRRGADARGYEYARRAGDRALALLAFEEAERLYTLALTLLDRLSRVDARLRASLLVAVGTVQNRAGSLERAKETFLQAAAAARSAGARDLLARAALGYGGELAFPEAGARDDVHIALLEEAIVACGDTDSELYARLLVHLATALYFTDAASRRVALCDHAVTIIRRLDDPHTVAEVLLATHGATSAAGNARERLGIADSLLRLAARGGDRAIAFRAHAARVWDHLELGAMAAAEDDLEACDRLARELRQPSYDGLVTVFRATRAIVRGRLVEAEGLAGTILATGRWLGRAVDAIFFLQIMTIRYLQGRIGELVDPLRAFVAMNPGVPAARCGLALAFISLGLASEARGEVEQVLAQSLIDMPRDVAFLPAMVQLSEACALIGEGGWMQTLYDVLLPYAAFCAVFGNGASFLGSVSHYLGLLARDLGRHDDAARHLEQGLAVHAGMGAEPWLALSQVEYGALLLAGRSPSDTERGRELVSRALATADALGMARLATHARALRNAPPSLGRSESPQVTVSHGVREHETSTSSASADAAVFRAEGDYWTIAYAGRELRLRDSRGLRYLAELLHHPGREFHATELVRLAARDASAPSHPIGEFDQRAVSLGDTGETIDDQARREYRRHLESLREQLEEACANNDVARAERLREEIAAVAHALSSTPRGRRVAAHAERARLTITKGIKAALAKIQANHPVLGRHLVATVRRGYVCIYAPDPRHPITWAR
jgi:tetratricopeptide (TPR) repeat protein